MRKLFCILILGLSINLSIGQIEIGISGQTNLAYEKPLGNNVTSDGIGIHVGYGIVFDKYFTDNYAISTGLEIMNSRVNFESNFATASIGSGNYTNARVYENNVQYLTIPFGLKLKSVEIGYGSIFANFGLLPSYALNQSSLLQSDNVATGITFFKDIMLAYRLGGGYSYSLGGSTSLNIGLYYDASLTDITRVDGDKGLLFRSIALKGSIMF